MERDEAALRSIQCKLTGRSTRLASLVHLHHGDPTATASGSSVSDGALKNRYDFHFGLV